jgi:hypothetical protein
MIKVRSVESGGSPCRDVTDHEPQLDVTFHGTEMIKTNSTDDWQL